jgi:hypothetical protein
MILGLVATYATQHAFADSFHWFPWQNDDRKRHKRKKNKKIHMKTSAEKSPFDLSVFVSDFFNIWTRQLVAGNGPLTLAVC